MKVVLVDNLIMPDEGSLAQLDVHPHLGLLAIAAVAEEGGHQVRIYDPKRAVRDGVLGYDAALYEAAAGELLGMHPDAVGFTALGCSFLFAANVAAILKRREPELPILLGGPHATMLDRPILDRFGQFDVIVRHEADETFPAILERLGDRAFDTVPGVSWRAADGTLRFTAGRPKVADLDNLPIASYEYYPVEALQLPLLRIEAGRGCPFSCDFCSTAGFFQRSFRLKSPERLVCELDRLHARYGCRDFKLDHDMFTVNRRKVIGFCEAVIGRGYRWRASARVDCVDDDLLARMAEAGCVSLYFGIETGSPRMQSLCRKRLDLDLVEPVLDRANELGIETTASFITGFPDETAADQDDTLDLLGRCARRPACLPQLHLLAPEPGTPLIEAHGGELLYDGVSGPYNSGLLAPGDEAVILGSPEIFPTYYHYSSRLPRRRQILAVELVDALRRLGPRLFDHVLRFFGGRLSRLAAELDTFAEDGVGEPVSVRLVRFAGERFGRHHYLVSLLRYGIHVHPTRPPPPPAAIACDPGRRYVAGRSLHILDDMHDCAELIARIATLGPDEVLADDAAAPQFAYLLVGDGDGIVPYRAPAAAAAVVGLFEEPRSPASVAALVGANPAAEAAWWPSFASLVEHGVLVEAAAEAGDALAAG